MRHLFAFVLMIVFVGSAAAVDLGAVQKDLKTDTHVGMNPGTPDGREGGEDMATAMPIVALPFNDGGNTFDNVDDYDFYCPWESGSPDVVYSYTPGVDMEVSVDLCGSSYDTKTYIMDAAFHVIDCNDDAYFDDICGTYVSLIEGAALVAGTEYFIVVDGYGGDAGDYLIEVDEFLPAQGCVLECGIGLHEGEPELGPDYQDAFNGGCNSPEFGAPWANLTIAADLYGELHFCGIAGWTDAGRDTDWNYLMMGQYGTVEIIVDAEQPTAVYTLTMTSCDDVAIDQSMTVGICIPGTLVIQGNPGDIIMVWFGAAEFTPPLGFVGYEYNYIANFTGLYVEGITDTENVSFDGIKSLYR